ncbi:MAG: glycosyl hydrolase [Planctomycetota bacterium]
MRRFNNRAGSANLSAAVMRRATVFAVALAVLAAGPVQAVDSAGVRTLFANPPREYSTAPLWVWNEMLTAQHIVSTLRDLAGQSVKQVFVHPRPGLMTPYLSDDWFRMWKVALEEAERLDMNIWIYDENSYPSGFAGGLVPDAMPESCGRNLFVDSAEDVVAVFRQSGDTFRSLTPRPQPSGADCLIASIKLAKTSPWYGGKSYVNLLTPGVTDKFLEITMDAYTRNIGDEFGRRVPGVFTDEPQLRPAHGLPWADDLPKLFRKRWGYSLTDRLPGFVRPTGDWKRLRHNYFQLVLELFIDRWAKPYYEYCDRKGLYFTGHYWEHEWPRAKSVPDNMAVAAWQQLPGIDTLMNKYSEDVHAQFGNVRAVKEVSSVANQLGRKRVLCEAYGAGGWDLRFEDMKRIGDWLCVLGVNLLDEHLSYITIRGARKRDHPQSFSYHTPWWDSYHVLATYFTRLSAVLSQGEQINSVLLIAPTTTAWMYQADPSHSEHLETIGSEFQKMTVDLAKAQVEYDIGSEDIIAHHGSVKASLLKVGNRRYDTVVLPALTENLNDKTVDLLEAYTKAGGKILCCGDPPALIDGSPSGRCRRMALKPSWKQVSPNAVSAMLLSQSKDGFAVHRSGGDEGILYHHRRRLDDGEILFLVNTSIDAPTCGHMESPMRSIERWNLGTGDVSPYPFTAHRTGVRARFELAPCGSLLLFLSKRPGDAVPPEVTQTANVAPAGPLRIRRVEQNVLTIDYVDVTAGGETKKDTYFYEASRFVFQRHGMEGNPWDSAVQFRDELITRTFPPDSGFEAAYRFTIEGGVPKPLYIVIERPDLYTVTCNGKRVSARKDRWWLDRAFGKIDITRAAKRGENVVTIKASPMTVYHELESAYVLGNFALRAAESGFVIVTEKPLELGPWNEQGLPLYAAGVAYAQDFRVPTPGGRYVVSLSEWYGSVAKVVVNGRPAGYIYHRPWECDITNDVAAGKNTIEVVVIGTLRNTLGPHHGNQPLGSAWPSMFRRAPQTGPPPGSQYQSIAYGLFKPFELHERAQ